MPGFWPAALRDVDGILRRSLALGPRSRGTDLDGLEVGEAGAVGGTGPVISVDEFRAALGPDAPDSDADVAALRDLVTALAEAVLDSLSKAPSEAEQEAS